MIFRLGPRKPRGWSKRFIATEDNVKKAAPGTEATG